MHKVMAQLADEDLATLFVAYERINPQGVAGITTGMVYEILHLTETERHQLTEIVVDVALDDDVLYGYHPDTAESTTIGPVVRDASGDVRTMAGAEVCSGIQLTWSWLLRSKILKRQGVNEFTLAQRSISFILDNESWAGIDHLLGRISLAVR